MESWDEGGRCGQVMGGLVLEVSDLTANHRAKVNLLQRMQVISEGVARKKGLWVESEIVKAAVV